MKNLHTLFPAYREPTRIVRQPRGAILIADSDPCSRGLSREIDQFEFEILRQVTGENSLARILELVCESVVSEQLDVQAMTLGYFEGLFDLIAFHDGPRTCPPTIVGNGLVPLPTHVSVELTDYCNLACRHCYRDSHPRRTQFVDTARLLEVFREMHELGVLTVELTGGEPTSHADFDVIFERGVSLFHLVPVISNGTLIDHARAALLASHAKRTFTQVDLDGDDAATHERLRGVPGSFDTVCGAIELLASHGVPLRVVMNVYPGNADRLRATCALSRRLGATTFMASPVFPMGRGASLSGLSIDAGDMTRFAQQVRELEAGFPGFVSVTPELAPAEPRVRKNCGAGSSSIAVGPDGEVRPCLMDASCAGMGNVFSHGYADLTRSDKLKEFAELEAPSEAVCGTCTHSLFCKGCFTRPWTVMKRTTGDGAFRCIWGDHLDKRARSKWTRANSSLP